MAENKVIIIGIEHHNSLNLARFFYMEGIKSYGVITPVPRLSSIEASRCWEQVWKFPTTDEALNYLIEKFGKEEKKPVLFPTSDDAAYHIDLRLNELKKYFIVPGIRGEQGALSSLMDKAKQKTWAMEHSIPTAYGKVLELADWKREEIHPIFDKYPCIIKPAASVFGDKLDICVCRNETEARDALDQFRNKNYKKVLIEEYLRYEYEILLTGAVFAGKKNMFSCERSIRDWPEGKGTASYRKVIAKKEIGEKCKKIMDVIQQEGYEGLVDVELFSVGGEIYLNEINWRNGGGLYHNISNKYNFPYLWYCSAVGKSCKPDERSSWDLSPDYSMTETSDIRYPLYRHYGWRNWFSDVRRTKNFAYWCRWDMKPAFLHYIRILRLILLKRY